MKRIILAPGVHLPRASRRPSCAWVMTYAITAVIAVTVALMLVASTYP